MVRCGLDRECGRREAAIWRGVSPAALRFTVLSCVCVCVFFFYMTRDAFELKRWDLGVVRYMGDLNQAALSSCFLEWFEL